MTPYMRPSRLATLLALAFAVATLVVDRRVSWSGAATTLSLAPETPRLAAVRLIGNCLGPPSPGESILVRAGVEYSAPRSGELIWGLRATVADGAPARWLRPARTERRSFVDAGDGRLSRGDRLAILDGRLAMPQVDLRAHARFRSRGIVESRSLSFRVGATLAVRAVDEQGADVPGGISLQSGGCWHTRGSTRSTERGTWALFYHLDPAVDVDVMATALGYEPKILCLSAGSGEIESGALRRVTLVLKRKPAPDPRGFPLDPTTRLGLVVGEVGSRALDWDAGPEAEDYSLSDQPSDDPVLANRSGWNCRVHVEYEGQPAVDWYLPQGTPVVATMDGTVTLSIVTVSNPFDIYGVDREPYLGNPDRSRAPLSPFPGPGGGKGVFARVENAGYVTDYAHLEVAATVSAVPAGSFLDGYSASSDYAALFAPLRDYRVSTAIARWTVQRGT